MQTAPRIGAIETEYAGVRFRSRLEARWAVFFDALGLKWEHEPEAYTDGTTWYTPDFWLPELELFWEVKPNADYDRTKPKMLVEVTGSELVVSTGSPMECRSGDWAKAHGGLQADHWQPRKSTAKADIRTGVPAGELSSPDAWIAEAVEVATRFRFWEPGQPILKPITALHCRPPKLTTGIHDDRHDELVKQWFGGLEPWIRRSICSVHGREGSIVITFWNQDRLPPRLDIAGGAEMDDGDWFSYHVDNHNWTGWLRCAS